jgi:biopolymer transport protein ExbB
VQRQLEESLAELNQLRQQVLNEKIPLSRKLKTLESKLIEVRLEQQQASRRLDSTTLDLSNLNAEIKSRREEATYLSNLLSEYIRNFESRLHIAELQRYRDLLEAARLAPENRELSAQEIYQTQAALVIASLDRLHDALGGTRFEGTAVEPNGVVKSGMFVLVGPAALFRSDDGQHIGTAEQRLGSREPAIIGFRTADHAEAAEQLITTSSGQFPLDPTLGNAHKIESTKETLWEHVQKGGPVMLPIFGLAGAALLVALYKWFSLLFLRKPSRQQIRAVLDAVAQHDEAAARQQVERIRGPIGSMLAAGVEYLREPRDLIEEVMYEEVLTTRLRLQNMLPFIAICAAAPLLGLLGTVTGIINTFKLITVFGTGDVKTLSGGISEALITTKFGLIVAVPSLLLHAFLSRKARSAIDQMEKAAIAFANQVSKARHERLNHSATNDGLRPPPKPELPDADMVQALTTKPDNGAGDPP